MPAILGPPAGATQVRSPLRDRVPFYSGPCECPLSPQIRTARDREFAALAKLKAAELEKHKATESEKQQAAEVEKNKWAT